jgi:hypothetical protein
MNLQLNELQQNIVARIRRKDKLMPVVVGDLVKQVVWSLLCGSLVESDPAHHHC